MVPWRRLIQTFLDKMVRQEGLGDALDEKECPCCENAYTRQSRRFHCMDCGMFVQCLNCIVSRHSLYPLHRLKVCVFILDSFDEADMLFRSGLGITGCPLRSRSWASSTSWVMADSHALIPLLLLVRWS
jgi:hypothetical protein